MKLVLTDAVAVIAATFATAVLAQTVSPNHRAELYADANGQTLESGKPRTEDGRDWQNGNAMMLHHAYESDRYRYHGGPKSND